MSLTSSRQFLLVTHRVPVPPDKGDRIRSYHLLRHLARRGAVDLAYPAQPGEPAATAEALAGLCRRVAAVPNPAWGRWSRGVLGMLAGRSLTEGFFGPPGLGAQVAHWVHTTEYDAVVAFSSGVLPVVLDRGRARRRIVDLVDVDSQKWRDYARRTAPSPLRWLLDREAAEVAAWERRAGLAADAVVLATRPEAALYREVAPGASATVVTIANGVDLDAFLPEPEPAAPDGAVFVGQLDYRANVLGLTEFARTTWPSWRERQPAATLRIVGRNPVAAVRRLGRRAGITVVGPVADVRPELARARVVVVPLPVARGVQNKVLEALAAGRPVIASRAALEGLDAVPGRDVLAADTPAEWLAALAAVWDDPARRHALGAAGRRYVERHHRWSETLAGLDPLLGVGPDPDVTKDLSQREAWATSASAAR